MKETIQDVVRNYIQYREDTARHSNERLTEDLKKFNLNDEELKRALVICEEEWEKIDAVRAKIKLAKTNAVIGLVLFIPIILVLFQIMRTGVSTRFFYIILIGVGASFIAGVKGIIDQKKHKDEQQKIENDWAHILIYLQPFKGQKIKEFFIPNVSNTVPILRTDKGIYQLSTISLSPINTITSDTLTELQLKDKIIQSIISNGSTLAIELDTAEYLLYTVQYTGKTEETSTSKIQLVSRDEFRATNNAWENEKSIRFPEALELDETVTR